MGKGSGSIGMQAATEIWKPSRALVARMLDDEPVIYAVEFLAMSDPKRRMWLGPIEVGVIIARSAK